jgi:hypothetical protein
MNHQGYYLMAPSKWPQCFTFMENGLIGHLRGWNQCDPGHQGYWKFVPHKDERGQPDGYYLITPKKPGWEDKWFVYVESGVQGYLSSWSGDPGPQGWFKIEPWCTDLGTQNKVNDQITQTLKQLPTMPMLGSKESGYHGPNRGNVFPAQNRTDSAQSLSEIRLEVTYSEAVSVYSLQPRDRELVFHVDPNMVFSKKVGRQVQESFFAKLVPQRDMLASLSREIFELTLQPPASCPSLKKISRNMVQVSSQTLQQNDTVRVSDGASIRIGGQDSHSHFLEFRISCVHRQGGTEALNATCMHLDAGTGGRGRGYMDQAPPPAAAPMAGYMMETRVPEYDSRPGTVPQHLGYGDSPDRGGSKAVLECVFSQHMSDLSRYSTTIPLIPDQEVAVGRMHQMGFFEKLLPDQDSLACISRKHLTARLHRGGHMVEIENVSRNTVMIDGKTLGQHQKGELREGSILKFTALGKPLLEFRLKSEGGGGGGGSGMPATRYPAFAGIFG